MGFYSRGIIGWYMVESLKGPFWLLVLYKVVKDRFVDNLVRGLL